MLKKSISIFCLATTLIFAENFSENDISKNQDLEAFLSLPLTEDDKLSIKECILFFSTQNIAQIIENRQQLEIFRNQAHSIHGLRLISFILTDPDTSQHMKSIILEADLKLAYTTIVLEAELMDLIENGVSDQHLSGFADFLHLDKKTIYDYIDQENYRDLTKYLLQI